MSIVPSNQEIRILTKNFIDADSTITLSHGGDGSLLYDRDKSAQYSTVGGKRDRTQTTIDITFNIGSTETEMTLNAIIMLNHNLKDFEFQYWNGSEYLNLFGNADNDGTILCVTMGAIKTSRIKLIMSKTLVPNQEKKIGQLIIARQRHSISENPSSYEIITREKKTIMELGDGQRHIAYSRFSTNRTSKYGCRASFTVLPRSDYEFLEFLKNEATPFLWYPESVTRPDEIFLVNWVNPFLARYTVSNKNAGYDTTLELEEV